MGEDEKNMLNDNDSRKNTDILQKDGLFQFLFFYSYLIFGNFSILPVQKFLFCLYYLI